MNDLRKRNFFYFYTILFALLFLQFPLNDSLPGNFNSLFLVASGNAYLNKFISLFSSVSSGIFLYPETHFFQFGESSFAGAGLFSLFKLVGFNDIWAYYCFIIILFVATAFSIFLLASLYVNNKISAFFGGLFFSCSTFVFANIDDVTTICYAGPALSAYFFKRYLLENDYRNMVFAGLIGGIQAYFNMYVFSYQTLFLLVFFLLNIKKENWRIHIRWIILSLGIYIVIPLPLILSRYLMMVSGSLHHMWVGLQLVDDSVLHPVDLFGSLRENLIYPVNDTYYEGVSSWLETRKRCFVGVIVPLLALLGLLVKRYKRNDWLTVALFGAFLSIGIEIGTGWENRVIGLTHMLVIISPVVKFLRLPFLALFLTLFSMAILATFGLDIIVDYVKKIKKRRKLILFSCLTVIFLGMLVENVPFSMAKFPLKKQLEIPAGYSRFFQGKNDLVVLDLPTSLWIGNTSDLLFDYNRELIYMNWQTHHKQNAVIGVNEYYPKSRIELQEKVLKLPEVESFMFLKRVGVDYIAYHKQMILPEMSEYFQMPAGWRHPYFYTVNENMLLGKLKTSSSLKVVFEDDNTCILQLIDD